MFKWFNIFGDKPIDIYSNKQWFVDVVNDYESTQRVTKVLNINDYILRKHKILSRTDGTHKGEPFETAKIVINSIKSIIDFHVSYCVGNSISLTGHKDIVEDFNKLYKWANYTKTDREVTTDLYKYGDAFEYVYVDSDNKIKSKVITNGDAYPVFDENYNYIAFVEYYPNSIGDKYYIVYYPDKVDEYKNNKLLKSNKNLTGLPIHYSSLDKSEYQQFGDSIVNDLIPIMDKIEYLLSKTDDSVTTLSLNPVGKLKGNLFDTSKVNIKINKEMVGGLLRLQDDTCDFEWETSMLDHATIKLLLETLINQFYVVAGVPPAIVGGAETNNVSEVSLQMLFTQADNKAKKTVESLKEGMRIRFEYFRKLRALQGISFPDNVFDSLDIKFNYARPVDKDAMFKNLKIQYEAGAISRQSIIENSPYTTDAAEEVRRIEAETGANPANTKDKILATGTNETQTNNNKNLEENK